MIIALKTNQDPAEIYLLADFAAISQNSELKFGEILAQKIWDAGRTLARDLFSEIEKLISENPQKNPENSTENLDDKKPFAEISGIIIFQGPGSFTGLRIGITVANAIAYAENIPIVGAQNSKNSKNSKDYKNHENWRENGLKKIAQNQNDKIVLPEYGAAPNITKAKK